MYKGHTISIVIPCKNEQDALSGLLKKMPRWIDEIIVVDNNSTDKTVQVARSLGAKVLTEKRKDHHGIGYGYAHQKGLKSATGDIVVTMDGDSTYPVNQIKPLIQHMLNTRSDFVSGSRFPLQETQAISNMRKLGVWILNTQVRCLYAYPMQDILSGMWVMRRTTIKKLQLKQGGWDLSPEIKLNALTNPEITFSEFHITHHHRDNGASKQKLWETGLNHLKYILKRKITTDNQVFHWVKSSSLSLRLLEWTS